MRQGTTEQIGRMPNLRSIARRTPDGTPKNTPVGGLFSGIGPMASVFLWVSLQNPPKKGVLPPKKARNKQRNSPPPPAFQQKKEEKTEGSPHFEGVTAPPPPPPGLRENRRKEHFEAQGQRQHSHLAEKNARGQMGGSGFSVLLSFPWNQTVGCFFWLVGFERCCFVLNGDCLSGWLGLSVLFGIKR